LFGEPFLPVGPARKSRKISSLRVEPYATRLKVLPINETKK
jgi:hypothetical protein